MHRINRSVRLIMRDGFGNRPDRMAEYRLPAVRAFRERGARTVADRVRCVTGSLGQASHHDIRLIP
jgi:hypothetical protein